MDPVNEAKAVDSRSIMDRVGSLEMQMREIQRRSLRQDERILALERLVGITTQNRPDDIPFSAL